MKKILHPANFVQPLVVLFSVTQLLTMNKLIYFFLFSFLALNSSAQNFSCYNLDIPQASTWTLYNSNGEIFAQGVSPEANAFCIPAGCFQLNVESLTMNPLPMVVTVYDASANVVPLENFGNEFYFVGLISNNAIEGCTDPGACNFNPNATCSNYSSCDYSCQGCTNPVAFNFNPTSTIDNGTCSTDHWATFNV